MTSVTASQRDTILALLQERGTVTNVTLNRICYRYSARIHELRKDGHLISTVHLKDRVVAYVYLGRRGESS